MIKLLKLQLKSIKKFINGRKKIAKIYDKKLSGIKNIELIKPSDNKGHNYFKYIVSIGFSGRNF